MRVGFSGSRWGMTSDQRLILMRELVILNARDLITEFHHGLGGKSDNDAHYVASLLHCYIIGHPSTPTGFNLDLPCDEIRPVKKPLVRNHDICFETDILMATPMESVRPDNLRGHGTWTTLGYMTGMGKPVMIIHRDGSVSDKIWKKAG